MTWIGAHRLQTWAEFEAQSRQRMRDSGLVEVWKPPDLGARNQGNKTKVLKATEKAGNFASWLEKILAGAEEVLQVPCRGRAAGDAGRVSKE